ncbi:hypothetical protein MSPP1_003156 [Malassezia sp. CBS 17886]|nr:hypothetical protein MSPP1_003156 [Malassezia sp. CBS 17886]
MADAQLRVPDAPADAAPQGVHPFPENLYRRSSPRTESYGFALYTFASVLWLVWVVWAASPEWLLESVGIAWFPRRDWAYLLIAWSLVLVLFSYFAFVALNLFHTPPLHSTDLVVAERLPSDHPLYGLSVAESAAAGAPLCDDVYDMSPGLVSRMLYLRRGTHGGTYGGTYGGTHGGTHGGTQT